MKVRAYNAHGDLVFVPEHWLSHPLISKNFSAKPPKRAKRSRAPKPKAAKTAEVVTAEGQSVEG